MSGASGTDFTQEKTMRKRSSIWPALILYVVATAGLLLLLFLFLQMEGLSWAHFAVAMVMFVPAIAAVGYLLLGDAAEGKERQDARLEHLTHEILHEINLPIATIKSNLQMLAVRTDNRQNLKRIARAEEALTRLQRLYDGLVYSIRREIQAIEAETFDLAEVVQERVAVHAEMRRNRFEVLVAPLRIHADRIGLEQVLDNLFQNSMKYSEPSEPITVTLEGTQLQIRDEGIGMDAAQIARIYERYYQGDSHAPGEGIGLALVKRYCDEARIAIRIDSVVGGGTTVTLDFEQVVVS